MPLDAQVSLGQLARQTESLLDGKGVSQLQTLRGMVDLLPEQTRRWQAVETVARDHFHCAA